MKRSRVVKLLNILSESEKKLLQKHIKNSDKEAAFKAVARHLLQYCKQPNLLENEIILKTVNEKITKEHLGTFSAQLFQFVENFVLNNWLNKLDEKKTNQLVQKELLLLDYYKTKELPGDHSYINNLDYLINTKQKQINKHLNKREVNNISHYYLAHRLNYHQYYGLNDSILSKGEDYIKATLNNLDMFYCLAKLKFAGEISLRNWITNEQNKVFLFEELSSYGKTLASTNDDDFIVNPLAKIYYLCSELAANPLENHLTNLKNTIIKYESDIDDNELNQLLTLLINFNTFINRSNNVDLSKNSYELLKLGLKREIFNVNGLIRPIFLINFCQLCSEFSSVNEIKSIMKQYENRLAHNLIEPTFNLCNAFICWKQKDYKMAIEHTKRKPKRSTLFFTHQKIINIKCFYELSKNEKSDNENDYIGNMLLERKSLKNYLRRKDGNFQSIDNFLSILLKLIDPNILQKQLFELVNFSKTPIAAKRWLLRKVEEK